MKLLGIDFGLKKVGLALSDGFLVEPLGVVRNKNQIKRICQEQGVEKIVIGLSEGKMAEKTKRFGQKLKLITGLPVDYQDETLSSQEAKKLMVKIGKPQKKRRDQEHAIAAALILRHYLTQRQLTD